MQEVWNEYYKTVLGPLEVAEDRLHPPGCTRFTCTHTGRISGVSTQAEKMWRWEDYARKHYREPQISGRTIKDSLRLVSMALALVMFK